MSRSRATRRLVFASNRGECAAPEGLSTCFPAEGHMDPQESTTVGLRKRVETTTGQFSGSMLIFGGKGYIKLLSKNPWPAPRRAKLLLGVKLS